MDGKISNSSRCHVGGQDDKTVGIEALSMVLGVHARVKQVKYTDRKRVGGGQFQLVPQHLPLLR